MSDAVIFVLVLGGLFVLRIIAATVVFFWILPEGVRCPNCDAITVAIHSRWLEALLPWYRNSWCLACGWDGLLRRPPRSVPLPPVTTPTALPRQPERPRREPHPRRRQ